MPARAMRWRLRRAWPYWPQALLGSVAVLLLCVLAGWAVASL